MILVFRTQDNNIHLIRSSRSLFVHGHPQPRTSTFCGGVTFVFEALPVGSGVATSSQEKEIGETFDKHERQKASRPDLEKT